MHKKLKLINNYINKFINEGIIDINNYTIDDCIIILKDDILIKLLNDVFKDNDTVDYNLISYFNDFVHDILELYCNEHDKKIINTEYEYNENNNDFSNNFNIYISDIKKYSVLNKETQIKLFLDYKENNNKESKDLLINSNQKLILNYALTKTKDEYILLDLIQEGNIAMLEVLDKFDPNKGCNFSTYALWYIKRGINYYFDKTRYSIKRSKNSIELEKKIYNFIKEFNDEYFRNPTDEEIINNLNITKNLYLSTITNSKILSLNNYINEEEDDELINFIEDEHDFTIDIEKKHYVNLLLKEIEKILSPDWYDILLKKMGIGIEKPMTLEEIAKEYNVTKQSIGNKYLKSIEKINNHPKTKKLIKEDIEKN